MDASSNRSVLRIPLAKKNRAQKDSPTPGFSRICIVGSGWTFTSGISHYTYCLGKEFSRSRDTTVILLGQLIPTFLYPGRGRVGKTESGLSYPPGTEVLDGVSWFWGKSILGPLKALVTRRPQVVIFQWWTVAVLHTYLLLAVVARSSGSKLLIEFHETQDVGEAAMWPARLYMKLCFRWLKWLSSGCIVHSEFDRARVHDELGFGDKPCSVIYHGPYDHLAAPVPPVESSRPAPSAVRLLYFGVIRPYKGLDVLAEALQLVHDRGDKDWHLTIAGEPWEGYRGPLDTLAGGPMADQVTIVAKYVSDDELKELLREADVIVLPYLRSSASGPLHIAMSWGLPVIISSVGGLTEVASLYDGAILVPPNDSEALADAIVSARALVGTHYDDPVSWANVVRQVDELTAGWFRDASLAEQAG